MTGTPNDADTPPLQTLMDAVRNPQIPDSAVLKGVTLGEVRATLDATRAATPSTESAAIAADRTWAAGYAAGRAAALRSVERGKLVPAGDPEYMCPNCVTPWKCNGPHIPAALRSTPDAPRPETPVLDPTAGHVRVCHFDRATCFFDHEPWPCSTVRGGS